MADDRNRVLRDALIGGPMSELGGDDHLTYEQLAALVDDEVDDVDREIAEVHLGVCSTCAEELADLRKLKVAAPPVHPPSWNWPAWAAAAAVVIVAGAAVWALRDRLWPSSGTEIARTGTSPTPPAIVPGAAPRVVIALKDGGGEITLDDNGNLGGVGATPTGTLAATIKATLTTGRVDVARALEGLRGPTGALMGTPTAGVPFVLTLPVGVVVPDERPTLRWQRLDGASTYVVRIFDTQFNEVARSAPLTNSEWKLTTPLKRGTIYVWQVTAIRNGEEIKSPLPPAPEARFKVLGANEATAVESAAKTYSNSHLVLGSIYAQAGLLEEAEREYRLLLAANPDSQIVKDLVREIANARHR